MKRFLLVLLLISLLGASSGAKVAIKLPNTSFLQLTPPPEDEVVIEIEQALQKAIVTQAENNLAFLMNHVEAVDIEVSDEQDFAALWLGMYDQETGEPVPSEPGLAFAVRAKDSNWNVILPADPAWEKLLDAAPEDILSSARKDYWREVNEPAVTSAPSAPLTGYLLPWARGYRVSLSQSTAHDRYTPSGTAHYSFDFYISGQMWEVYASKAGRVVRIKEDVPTCFEYSCADTQILGNYIVLEDTTTVPTTYQLYLHLAYDSVPNHLTIGSYVNQGQFIGIADNTGQSWGPHLHFMVHANPKSYWGQSVDIVFGDVAINGGRPRRDDDKYYFDFDHCYDTDVCITSQASYISGNIAFVDQELPTAGIITPTSYSSVITDTLALKGWAFDDGTGIAGAQFLANYDGTWLELGTPIPSSTITYNWNLCEAKVPNGPISIAIRASDHAGNLLEYGAMTQIIKNYDCATSQVVSPSVRVSEPVTGGYLNSSIKSITAEVINNADIAQVDFYYHSPDFVNSKWILFDEDTNGLNGWSLDIDPTGLPQTTGAAFSIMARDTSGRIYALGIWNLTVDAFPPESQLQSLDPYQESTAFPLFLDMTDNETGIAGFDIQQTENSTSVWQNIIDLPLPTLWQTVESEMVSSPWFLGKIGSSYGFRSRAYDVAGNFEEYPASPEAVTTVPEDVCSTPDIYEPFDNTRITASEIISSGVQIHNFCSTIPINAGLFDEDWVRITLTPGESYTVQVTPTGASTAVSLRIYDPDSDEPDVESASPTFGSPVIIHLVAEQEIYYLKLSHVDGRVAGRGVSYLLSVQDTSLVYLPFIVR